MKRALLILTVSATVAACASTPSVPPPPPPPVENAHTAGFSAAQFEWSSRPGKASIRGTVATAGYSCAGGKVVLTPDAPFSRQRIKSLYGSIDHAAVPVSVVRSRQVAKAGGDYSSYVRTADCGADNRFVFEGLPAGGWFIILAVAPTGEHGGEPLALLRRVEVKKGEVRTTTLQ